ncbi:MAG: MFS transporter [Pseudomonadota bacterium]
MPSADRPATRLATRLAFFVAGFGIACWAPLVPFAKQRVAVDDALFGLLLLCIGVGSIVAMIATSPLSARHGSKPVIVGSGLMVAVIVPFLAIAASPLQLGIALFLFGGALGSLDVAANVHAVEVERAAGEPLMSGFHALFSIGGFAGAALMTTALWIEMPALAGTAICSVVMLAATLLAWPRLLVATRVEDGPVFVRPRGIVLLLSALTAAIFVAEAAVLDWGALLITRQGLVAPNQGGIGYILFAIAMTCGRLAGDRLTARIGDRATLAGGGSLAVVGFAVVLTVPVAAPALAGFVLIGLGASNVAPVLFRRAGAQTVMPAALAIGAITTIAYAGLLVGPAIIGGVAQLVGLRSAFWLLAGLVALVPLAARAATRSRP